MLGNRRLSFQSDILNICIILTFLLMFGHAKTSQLRFYYAVVKILGVPGREVEIKDYLLNLFF